MDKQVSLFRHLSLTCLTNLEDVDQLLHHLAQLAPPTHYVALQVDQNTTGGWSTIQAKKSLVSLIPNSDDINENLLRRKVIIN